MAEQMQTIKRRMKSVSSTERITNAMKLVSAAKLKYATSRFVFVRKNLKRVKEHLCSVISGEDAPSVYTDERTGQTLYVIVTGNKGLCGGYNSAIVKEVREINQKDANIIFLPMGTKGKEFCIRENYKMFEDFFLEQEVLNAMKEPVDEWDYILFQKISDKVLKQYKKGKIAKIVVVYTQYVNSVTQVPKSEQIFPLQRKSSANEKIYIEKGEDTEAFFDYFAKEYLAFQLYGLSVESALCEHSARRTAMNNASDNAKEMLEELTVYYNRARQSAITNEIIDIIGGAEALN